jgi:hypothetical protein
MDVKAAGKGPFARPLSVIWRDQGHIPFYGTGVDMIDRRVDGAGRPGIVPVCHRTVSSAPNQ